MVAVLGPVGEWGVLGLGVSAPSCSVGDTCPETPGQYYSISHYTTHGVHGGADISMTGGGVERNWNFQALRMAFS